MKKTNGILLLLIGFTAFSCIPEPEPSPLICKVANEQMWDALHLGNYDSLPGIIQTLETAHHLNPTDAEVTAHLGFVHLWSFSERTRKPADRTAAQHIYKSNAYFKLAIEQNPDDARLKGFESATRFCKGALDKNVFTMLKGYISGKRAIEEWPQFNRFALSVLESQGGKNSLMFKQGLKYQWQLVDECSCHSITEDDFLRNPDSVVKVMVAELSQSRDEKLRRACWNSWIAPHNLEGFLLNFGDMLVKDGRIEEARQVYATARLSPNYNEWVFKDRLEKRIVEAELNRHRFNRRSLLFPETAEGQIFINSDISCVSCHQMSANEFEQMGKQYPGKDRSVFVSAEQHLE